MEQPTLGVIIERLDNFKNDNEQEHKSILAQVTKTNGAVADIQKWRYLITGALVIMNIFLAPIIVAIVIQYVLNLMK